MQEYTSSKPTTHVNHVPSIIDPCPTFWYEGAMHMSSARDWNGSGQSGTGQNGSGSGWNGSGQNGHGWGGGLKLQ